MFRRLGINLDCRAGRAGTFGWPASARMEALRSQFLDAPTADEPKRITRELQPQRFEHMPDLLLGAYDQPFAHRRTVSGMLNSFAVFYNIKKA